MGSKQKQKRSCASRKTSGEMLFQIKSSCGDNGQLHIGTCLTPGRKLWCTGDLDFMEERTAPSQCSS